MRRHHIWFLIAGFWLIDTVLTATHHGWQAAALPALVTAGFLAAGWMQRRRDRLQVARRPE